MGHLPPVLGEVLHALEAGDELEADEAFLVALHVLQQELVLRNVGVREIKLDLNIAEMKILVFSTVFIEV